MSAGNKTARVRMPAALWAEVWAAIHSRNERTAEAPWTLSDWIRQAVEDKLRHLARGRKPRRRPPSCGEGSGGAESPGEPPAAPSFVLPADPGDSLHAWRANINAIDTAGGEG